MWQWKRSIVAIRIIFTPNWDAGCPGVYMAFNTDLSQRVIFQTPSFINLNTCSLSGCIQLTFDALQHFRPVHGIQKVGACLGRFRRDGFLCKHRMCSHVFVQVRRNNIKVIIPLLKKDIRILLTVRKYAVRQLFDSNFDSLAYTDQLVDNATLQVCGKMNISRHTDVNNEKVFLYIRLNFSSPPRWSRLWTRWSCTMSAISFRTLADSSAFFWGHRVLPSSISLQHTQKNILSRKNNSIN